MSQPGTPKKRTREPEAKRAAIRVAARATFAELGYERATLRKIAERAGVPHGLVTLHFGNKERLFIEVAAPQTMVENIAGDLPGLPERVARTYITQMESGELAESFAALMRSAASDQQAAKDMLNAMREQSVAAYLTVTPAADAEARVEMAVAVLHGVALNRYVLADGPLASMTPEEVIDWTTRLLRAVLIEPGAR